MATWEPYSRTQWGARTPLVMEPSNPTKSRAWMRQEVSVINVHHSVTIATDDHDMEATDDAFHDMRVIEAVGMQRFGMFSYSYAIHPLGPVMVGCGGQIGAHTKGYNSSQYGVVFIGNYENDKPTKEQEISFAQLCVYLNKRSMLVDNFTIRGHNATKATACPGKNVTLILPRLEVFSREAVRRANNGTPSLPPTDTGELTMADIKIIMDKLTEIEDRVVTLERSVPRIWRASNDKKLWLVGPAGKIHVEDEEAAGGYILAGVAAPGEIKTATSSWLRKIPTILDN